MPVDFETIWDKAWEIIPPLAIAYVGYKWFVEPAMKEKEFDPFNPLR